MSDRKRRLEIAKTLKELLQSKGKTPTVKYQQTYEELREASDLVSEELWPALIYFLLSETQNEWVSTIPKKYFREAQTNYYKLIIVANLHYQLSW